MTRERTTRSDESPGRDRRDGGARKAAENLTRAEARALSRCAPLTPAEFKAQARVAEQSVDPLRTVLTGLGDTSSEGTPAQR